MATITSSPLSFRDHVGPISVINILKMKGSQRWTRQRRKSRAFISSALVEANVRSGSAISERTSRSRNNINGALQADITSVGEKPVVVAKYSRDLADDMQAEARAMTRAIACSVYSPEMLATKYGSRPTRVLQRTSEILFGLGSFAFKLWLDKQKGQLDQNKTMRASELRKIFTALGPTFVKIGQGLSTRPDICPPEYLEELSQLQDDLPTFSNAEAFTCIERELGFALEDIYSYISPNPIAAASLGQVYKARLKYSGQTVAVKVQRPGIEEAIGLDFYLIRGLAHLINEYVDIITSDIVALVDEFGRRVYQELNYVQVCAGG